MCVLGAPFRLKSLQLQLLRDEAQLCKIKPDAINITIITANLDVFFITQYFFFMLLDWNIMPLLPLVWSKVELMLPDLHTAT